MSRLPRALLIDDNPADLYLHSIRLRDSALFGEIHAFEEPDAALAYLQSSDPADTAIVLDVNMPRMNAFAFLKAFDQLPDCQRERCAITVASTSEDSVEAALALSHPRVASFGPKPVTARALAELRERLQASAASLSVASPIRPAANRDN